MCVGIHIKTLEIYCKIFDYMDRDHLTADLDAVTLQIKPPHPHSRPP